ncbi:hypothetical protein RCH10_000265 [Variovorax sp. GrIS 2.14]|jgi:hypothetical protein
MKVVYTDTHKDHDPRVFSEANVDLLVETLDDVLKTL